MMAVAMACVAVAAGCGKKAPLVAQPPGPIITDARPAPPPAPPAIAPPSPESARVGLNEDEIFARLSIEELNAARPLADAFFDLDQSTIRDDARLVLQRNAEWLRRWPSTRIVIEGHGDARGTSEYNLALAERRAHAAKAYLVGLGVSTERVQIVSKGEEEPVCVEADEACWQQNRRAHPIITAK